MLEFLMEESYKVRYEEEKSRVKKESKVGYKKVFPNM